MPWHLSEGTKSKAPTAPNAAENVKQQEVSYVADGDALRKMVLSPNILYYGDGLVTKSCPTSVTPCTVARQAPQSTGFSRQEYWSGLLFPSLGDLPDPGIEPRSPALQADSLLTELWGKPSFTIWPSNCISYYWPKWVETYVHIKTCTYA